MDQWTGTWVMSMNTAELKLKHGQSMIPVSEKESLGCCLAIVCEPGKRCKGQGECVAQERAATESSFQSRHVVSQCALHTYGPWPPVPCGLRRGRDCLREFTKASQPPMESCAYICLQSGPICSVKAWLTSSVHLHSTSACTLLTRIAASFNAAAGHQEITLLLHLSIG